MQLPAIDSFLRFRQLIDAGVHALTFCHVRRFRWSTDLSAGEIGVPINHDKDLRQRVKANGNSASEKMATHVD